MRRHDPIRFEVVRNALQAAVEESGVALARSAYSTNIKTRLDFSCAIFDKDLKVVVQAFSQPSHLGSLVFAVPSTVGVYGPAELRPGDGILVNDAHMNMSHLNDISLVSPLFYKDRLFGYSANLAHHVDIGGRAPGSIAVTTDIYQEGIILPGVKLVKKGEIDNDIYRLVAANVRGKKEFGGDIRAQVAANKLAQRRIVEIIDKFGVGFVETTIERLYEYTQRRTEAEMAKWPEGVYEAETFLDDDGVTARPIRIPIRLTIKGSHVEFDLTGAEAQRKAPMNSTYAQAYSSVVYSIKALLPSDIPVNHGFYQTVKLIAPKGTVVNCSHPAAVVGGWEVGIKVVEGCFRALAKAMPDRVAAEGKKTILHIAFGGVDPRSNESYVYLETLAGGYGGRPTKDGEDAVQAHHQNTENAPVEEMEIGYPVIIERYELVEDSDGPGEYRGGLGLRRVYRFRDHDATVTFLADTVKIPPHGMLGGMDGRPAEFSVLRNGKNKEILPSKVTFTASSRDSVEIRTPGGGGYGSPLDRDESAVLGDVIQGKISTTRAKDSYGVVIDITTLALDRDATAELRTRMRARGE